MISAYNNEWLANLAILKEAKKWFKNDFISAEQLTAIQGSYLCKFYHPNVMIRILLFIASWIAISGATGFFFLILESASENVIASLAIVYGTGLFLFAEKIFIQNSYHYKSGVTEGLLYHAAGFIIGGVGGLTDFNEHVMIITCMLVFLFVAVRYHDVILTIAAVGAFAFFIFYEMYELGGVMQQVIPLAMLVIFTPVYLMMRKIKQGEKFYLWNDCLTAAEVSSLIIICAAGNYLVVRELSIELLNMNLSADEEIPLAFVFYFLTIAIPVVYLIMGILKKDMVLLRVSMAAIAFSVFTFEYYFFHGLHEVILTVCGAVVLFASLFLYRFLKQPKNGFTHKKIWDESNLHAEAFIISQTMGGNQSSAEQPGQGGGGSFGGGGASGNF